MRITPETQLAEITSPVFEDKDLRAMWRSIEHDTWQQQVTDLGLTRGWEFHHQRISRQSKDGWPDCSLVRPPRLIFVEIKRIGDTVSRAQWYWLTLLSQVPAVECYVFWPTDWGEVVGVLS